MQRRGSSLLSAIKPMTFFSNFFYFFMFGVENGRIVVSKLKVATSFCFLIACSAVKYLRTSQTPSANYAKYEQFLVKLTNYLTMLFCLASHFNFQTHAVPVTDIWNQLFTLAHFITEKSFYRKAFLVSCLQLGLSNLFFFAYLTSYYFLYSEDFAEALFLLESCVDYFMIMHFCAASILFSNGLLLGWKIISVANVELRKLRKIEYYKGDRCNGLPFVKVAKIKQLRSQMKMIDHDELSTLVDTYERVCRAARELNDRFGVSLASASLKNLMEMTLSCYFMIQHESVAVKLFSIWFLYCFLMELTVIYACEKFVEETKRTGEVLDLLATENSSQALKAAVESFSRHLLHRQVRFTACRLFDLDYQFLFSTLSGIITYLGVVVQFDKSS